MRVLSSCPVARAREEHADAFVDRRHHRGAQADLLLRARRGSQSSSARRRPRPCATQSLGKRGLGFHGLDWRHHVWPRRGVLAPVEIPVPRRGDVATHGPARRAVRPPGTTSGCTALCARNGHERLLRGVRRTTIARLVQQVGDVAGADCAPSSWSSGSRSLPCPEADPVVVARSRCRLLPMCHLPTWAVS